MGRMQALQCTDLCTNIGKSNYNRKSYEVFSYANRQIALNEIVRQAITEDNEWYV